MSEHPPPGYGYEQQHQPAAAGRPGELLDRFLARLIDALLLLVAVILIAVGISQDTQRRQAWHDRFAGGTQVLKIG